MSKINPYGLSSKEYARLYNVWKNMIDRCYNPKNQRYYTYGARGIRVCDEWLNDVHAFVPWALRNGWHRDLWIERIDVNGDYCPENCTFIPRKEQMRNRTNNINITIDGETKCMAEWCEIFGCEFGTAWMRYKKGVYPSNSLLFYPGDLRDIRHPRIIQLTFDGEVVAEYKRMSEAAKAVGVTTDTIRRTLNRKNNTTAGYRWQYEDGDG